MGAITLHVPLNTNHSLPDTLGVVKGSTLRRNPALSISNAGLISLVIPMLKQFRKNGNAQYVLRIFI